MSRVVHRKSNPMRSDGPVGCAARACVWAAIALAAAPDLALAAPPVPAESAKSAQRDFATPESAVDALVTAVRAGHLKDLSRILGPAGRKLIHSGDPVADREGRERFIGAYDKAHRIEVDSTGNATLILGAEEWPLPIPIARQADRWHFDTEASAQKIIDRRVGRNELNVIEVCREFVSAQREYASRDRQGAGTRQYAARFESSAGRRDGLYWEAAPGEEPSPLGPLFARARAEGYPGKLDKDRASDPPAPRPAAALTPYHGYYYRILTRQGAHAPGGAKDYLAGGQLTGGFALLAFPARWGDSGIMTFIVNQDGIVFEKNLGADTAKLAAGIEEYDPDPTWSAP